MNKNKILIVAIVFIVVIVAIIAILTITTSNQTITIESFEQKAKEHGFTVGEIDNLETQDKQIISAKMAISSNYSYFIEMYVLENEEATKEFYNEKKQEFEEQKYEGDTAKETSKNNTETYTLKSNGYCMYVSRTDNVLISYNVKESDEQKVTDFIKSL